MITNGKNGRVKRENSLLRLGGASAPPAFNIADLFTAGSYGMYMSVTDNVMLDAAGTSASIDEAVYEAYFNYAIGSGVSGSTAQFWQAIDANRPILRQDGALRYLDFDGTTEAGLTSRSLVDIGTTDAVTVIAGIMRDQNVNAEDVIGWSNNPANTSTFVLASTFDAASDNAGFASRGSGASSGARAGGTSIGTKYVLTGIGDVSTDLAEIRRNGVVLQSRTNVDQGTGNYNAKQTIYLGSRGGSSRWFTGRVYALVLINRVLSGTELANAEAWVASKTGVTI